MTGLAPCPAKYNGRQIASSTLRSHGSLLAWFSIGKIQLKSSPTGSANVAVPPCTGGPDGPFCPVAWLVQAAAAIRPRRARSRPLPAEPPARAAGWVIVGLPSPSPVTCLARAAAGTAFVPPCVRGHGCVGSAAYSY